jgi:nucleotide-binding universal stress UspA family protein
MYDYYLGGRDNSAADREAAEAVIASHPEQRQLARNNRAFLARAVEHLAAAGITQFVDIGTGIPTSPTVHEVARRTHPDARVVYVDDDPVVLAHARRCSPGTPRSPWWTPTCTTRTPSPSTPTWRG